MTDDSSNDGHVGSGDIEVSAIMEEMLMTAEMKDSS
jgi:hypothetical protein